jgi:hypothetical protein
LLKTERINATQGTVSNESVKVRVAAVKARGIGFREPPQRRRQIAEAGVIQAARRIQPQALEAVDKGVGAAAACIEAGVEDGAFAVRVVDVPLDDRAGAVVEAGDVVVCVLLDPQAFGF